MGLGNGEESCDMEETNGLVKVLVPGSLWSSWKVQGEENLFISVVRSELGGLSPFSIFCAFSSNLLIQGNKLIPIEYSNT